MFSDLRYGASPLRFDPKTLEKKLFFFRKREPAKGGGSRPKFPFFDFFWLSGTIVNIKKRVFERKLPLFTLVYPLFRAPFYLWARSLTWKREKMKENTLCLPFAVFLKFFGDFWNFLAFFEQFWPKFWSGNSVGNFFSSKKWSKIGVSLKNFAFLWKFWPKIVWLG